MGRGRASMLPSSRHREPAAPAPYHGEGRDTRLKRAQVSRACQRCRNLRRACSEYRPCQRCIRHGLTEQCLAMPGPVQLTRDFNSPPAQAQSSSPSDAHSKDSPDRNSPELVPPSIVEFCADSFFARLYSTIPILSREHVTRLRGMTGTSERDTEAHCVLAAMCSLVLLQVEESGSLNHMGLAATSNATYAERLFGEVVEAHKSLGRRPNPSFELCLLTFFLYACHAALLHHSQAFFFLREATTTWLLLRPAEDPNTKPMAERLFWVLLVSERSHGIRYQRPTTLQITAGTPDPAASDMDSALVGFRSLAALFSPLDTAFIASLNQETTPSPLSSSHLDHLETSVNAALKSTLRLEDPQKANLRVTQLWLRIIIWQLRLRLGHLKEEAVQHSLTFHYPLEVAKDLTLSTRDLPLSSIQMHGVGLTEKLFDVASAVVDVLARVPITPASPVGVVYSVGTGPEDDLNYLRRLITQLPGGSAIYDALLDKHIRQAVPGMNLGTGYKFST